MKKENRIKKNEEFSSIILTRKSFNVGSFVIYQSKRKEDHARFGISVSKKLGNAVMRNRIKRQIRMMIIEEINFKEVMYDYIVIVRKQFLSKSYIENKKCLAKAIKTSKIM